MVVTKKSQIGAGFFKPHIAALVKRIETIHRQSMKAHHSSLNRHIKASGIRMRKVGSGAEMEKIKKDTKAAIKAKADEIHQLALDKTEAAIEAAKTKVHNKIKSKVCPGAEGEAVKGSGWFSNAWKGVRNFASKLFHGVKKKVVDHGTAAINQVKTIVKNAPENISAHLNKHREDYMAAAWDGAKDVYNNGTAGVKNQAGKLHKKITKETQKLVGCGLGGGLSERSIVRAARGRGMRASGLRARGMRASGVVVRGGTRIRVVG